MRREVSVTLSLQQEHRFDLEGQAPLDNELARHWLDTQFTRVRQLIAGGVLRLQYKQRLSAGISIFL
jgi:hypothetical protein